MSKTMTLTCKAGHTWTRPAQRGRPPIFCPEHAPAKAEPKKEKISAIDKAEAAYNDNSAWIKKHTKISNMYLNGEITWQQRREMMPKVPTLGLPSDQQVRILTENGKVVR